MRSIKIYFLAVILSAAMFYSPAIYARTLKEVTAAFNINTAKKDIFKKYSKKGRLLVPYLLCVAAVRDDRSLCRYLNSDAARLCREQFASLHSFYKQLIIGGVINAKVIRACMRSNKGLTLKQCQELAKAFISQNPSICKVMGEPGAAECNAVMTGNPAFCQGIQGCQDKVSYVKAIRKFDPQKCDKIKDNSLRLLCKGDITMDENVCKQNAGFKKFIKLYYKALIEKKGGE